MLGFRPNLRFLLTAEARRAHDRRMKYPLEAYATIFKLDIGDFCDESKGALKILADANVAGG
jgi:hypothetical protein